MSTQRTGLFQDVPDLGKMPSHAHSAMSRGGAIRHALKDRGDDLYETPPQATRALLRHEATLGPVIWEPACGPGAMVEVLRAAGKRVIASDLRDYGCPDSSHGIDFLMERAAPAGVTAIVTNPPYKLADDFIRNALQLCPTVCMLLRLGFLEGAGRSDIIDGHLERVWIGVERLPMMHRDGWDGAKITNSAMPFGWFVFRRDLQGPQTFKRISWRG
jgi:hypothetical protein